MRWYVAQTQPRKEQLALQHLANQEFTTFCPRGRRVRMVGRRRVTVLEPFFPGYVFVGLDLARDRWRSVNGTIGVLRLVSFGRDPAAVPDGLVERLQALSDDRDELAFDERLEAGQRVRIVGGPLDALCGVLVTAEPKQRVTVLLELMTNATPVAIERDRLIAA